MQIRKIAAYIPHLSFLCLLFFYASASAEINFIPRLSAGMTYTDNVFLDPTDEEYDLITFISPGIDLNYIGRNSALGISYDPTYVNYTRFPERTYWRQSATLDAYAEVTRGTRLELTNTFLYTEDPAVDDTTVRQGREPYFTNTTTVGAVNNFGAEDLIDLRYTHYVLQNEDATIEDSSYRRPSLLVTYWFFPNRYAVEMEALFTVSDFEVSENFEDIDARFRFTKRFNRHLDAYLEYGHVKFDYQGISEDYRVYSPVVGFTWVERANSRFGASFGYFYQDNEISEDDGGVVGSVDMAYDWRTESHVTLSGSVGYDRAYFGAENLGFNPYYDVSGVISHLITRQLTGTVTAGYRRNLYTDETPDREDSIWRAGAGLAYLPLPWLTVSLDYLYRQIDSNIDTHDYIENRGTLSVTLAPRQPIRF